MACTSVEEEFEPASR